MAKAKTVNIHEAKTQFSKLIKRVEHGDEVIIARAGRPVARICALPVEAKPKRVPGTGKGFFSQEFIDRIFEPLPDEIQRYFEDEE
jgi:prevent-host-death family protein